MKKTDKSLMLVVLLTIFSGLLVSDLFSQDDNFTAVRAEVDFSNHLREWDGFGFNYVELAHTYDLKEFPQEYGGFSLLNEEQKQEIVDMVFGNDGLKVGLVKLFLDPLHQQESGGAFDHTTTTSNMLYFAKEGLRKTKARGDDLSMITTLYGPPAYMTKQKIPRGRDLDPAHREDLANYLIDWLKYLKMKAKLPVDYVSLHNEGESWLRWTQDGKTDFKGHDYNMFWPPELVVDFLKFLPGELKKNGLGDVGVTPGETSNWYRFSSWGYAEKIAQDKKAMEGLALITSHGFYNGGYGRWFGEHKSTGIDRLREETPGLHTWVTSTSWSKMNAHNIKEMHGNMYTAKVNGIIPWAGIQRHAHWPAGDPNPGCAFKVNEDGSYEVNRGYYYYKQITRAGQPGMAVAYTMTMDSEMAVIGFARNNTKNPDAFVVINISKKDRDISVHLKGTSSVEFETFRTSDDPIGESDGYDAYKALGVVKLEDGRILYTAPANSVTTFFGVE